MTSLHNAICCCGLGIPITPAWFRPIGRQMFLPCCQLRKETAEFGCPLLCISSVSPLYLQNSRLPISLLQTASIPLWRHPDVPIPRFLFAVLLFSARRLLRFACCPQPRCSSSLCPMFAVLPFAFPLSAVAVRCPLLHRPVVRRASATRECGKRHRKSQPIRTHCNTLKSYNTGVKYETVTNRTASAFARSYGG